MEEDIIAAIETLVALTAKECENGDYVIMYTQAILNLAQSLATLKELKRS